MIMDFEFWCIKCKLVGVVFGIKKMKVIYIGVIKGIKNNVRVYFDWDSRMKIKSYVIFVLKLVFMFKYFVCNVVYVL